MLTVIIELEGRTHSDVKFALEQASRDVREGRRTGGDSNKDRRYYFEVTGEPDQPALPPSANLGAYIAALIKR